MLPRPKITASEQAQVHERISAHELDDKKSQQEDNGNNRQPDNEQRSEPIFTVAFFEHDLHRSEADSDGDHTPPIPTRKVVELQRFLVERKPDGRY